MKLKIYKRTLVRLERNLMYKNFFASLKILQKQPIRYNFGEEKNSVEV